MLQFLIFNRKCRACSDADVSSSLKSGGGFEKYGSISGTPQPHPMHFSLALGDRLIPLSV